MDAEEATGFSEQGEPVTGSSADSETEAEEWEQEAEEESQEFASPTATSPSPPSPRMQGLMHRAKDRTQVPRCSLRPFGGLIR